MLLTTLQMSKVLGVSRATYSGWVKGKPIRPSNDEKVRVALRKMFKVVTAENWPKPEIIAMPTDQRFNTLLELVGKQE